MLSPGRATRRAGTTSASAATSSATAKIPVFGICLGHQGIGNLLEGDVNRAPMAMHGRLSRVMPRRQGPLQGRAAGLLGRPLPLAGDHQPARARRAHRRLVRRRRGDGGRAHQAADLGRPVPPRVDLDRVRAEDRRELLRPGGRATSARQTAPPAGRRSPPAAASRRHPPPAAEERRRAGAADADDRGRGADRARLRTALRRRRARPSGSTAPTRRPGWPSAPTWAPPPAPDRCCSTTTSTAARSRSAAAASRPSSTSRSSTTSHRELERIAVEPPEGVERGLVGGYVGYLGYELKADCGSPNVHSSDMPDAAMMLANRVVAVDHTKDETYVFALCRGEDAEAELWLDAAEELVARGDRRPAGGAAAGAAERPGRPRQLPVRPRPRAATSPTSPSRRPNCWPASPTRSASPTSSRPTPAPSRSTSTGSCAAATPRRSPPSSSFGENAIVSSSPERFISVDRQRQVRRGRSRGRSPAVDDPAEDAARAPELAEDEKTYAEHLMIVDLLRNDLGVVCDVDSVQRAAT